MSIDLSKYRVTSEYKEILRTLQKCSTEGTHLLWQTHALGRNIIPVTQIEIDFVGREVVVHFDSTRSGFEPGIPIFARLEYRMSVFKILEYRVQKNTLHFSFPTEVHSQELRSIPRVLFDPKIEKYITIRPAISLAQREHGSELNLRVIDATNMGMGLIISESNRSFLKQNRILWITKLQENTLKVPVMAEVVYINNELDSRYVKRKQKDLKVGLKLSSLLNNELYQQFLN